MSLPEEVVHQRKRLRAAIIGAREEQQVAHDAMVRGFPLGCSVSYMRGAYKIRGHVTDHGAASGEPRLQVTNNMTRAASWVNVSRLTEVWDY